MELTCQARTCRIRKTSVANEFLPAEMQLIPRSEFVFPAKELQGAHMEEFPRLGYKVMLEFGSREQFLYFYINHPDATNAVSTIKAALNQTGGPDVVASKVEPSSEEPAASLWLHVRGNDAFLYLFIFVAVWWFVYVYYSVAVGPYTERLTINIDAGVVTIETSTLLCSTLRALLHVHEGDIHCVFVPVSEVLSVDATDRRVQSESHTYTEYGIMLRLRDGREIALRCGKMIGGQQKNLDDLTEIQNAVRAARSSTHHSIGSVSIEV